MTSTRAASEAQDLPSGPWIPEWTLADRLRKARSAVGLGQRDFAERLDVSAGTYSQWEAGYARPRDVVAIARRIELLTRIPAAWILGVDALQPTPTPGGAVWAPRGSNPEPAVSTSAQVIDLSDARLARRAGTPATTPTNAAAAL